MIFSGLLGVAWLYLASFMLLLHPPANIAFIAHLRTPIWMTLTVLSLAWLPFTAPRHRAMLLAWRTGVVCAVYAAYALILLTPHL